MIFLEKKNRNTALKITPLIDPPTKPFPQEGFLPFQLFDDDETALQVTFANVLDYKTFNDLLVDEANQLLKTDDYPKACLLYTSPSPRDRQKSRMPSSA